MVTAFGGVGGIQSFMDISSLKKYWKFLSLWQYYDTGILSNMNYYNCRYLKLKRKRTGSEGEEGITEETPGDDDAPKPIDITPTFILLFVSLMCLMLVGLYFLYDYIGKYSHVSIYLLMVTRFDVPYKGRKMNKLLYKA